METQRRAGSQGKRFCHGFFIEGNKTPRHKSRAVAASSATGGANSGRLPRSHNRAGAK